MSAPFEAGSVYLASAQGGGDVRLVWKKGDGALAVPAGRYEVRHWSIEKEHEGETWIMSVTGQGGPKVEVRAGADLALDLETKVRLKARGKRHARALVLSLELSGGHHMGLSVIRKDRLVDIGYRVEDAGANALAEGRMTYG